MCKEMTMVDSTMARVKCAELGWVAPWDWFTDVNLYSAWPQKRKNQTNPML